MICPKCGCDNGGYGPDKGLTEYLDGSVWKTLTCLDCGYSQPFERVAPPDPIAIGKCPNCGGEFYKTFDVCKYCGYNDNVG